MQRKQSSGISGNEFTYEFSALYYLNWWLKYDSRFCGVLSHNRGASQKRLLALREAAGVYRIARNLKTKYDTKKKLDRFGPVLDVLSSYTAKDFTGKRLTASIEQVKKEIASAYGDGDPLSFTTKVLWLKFQAPIIIYDENVRNALQSSGDDLTQFYAEWRDAYDKVRVDIDAACKLLPAIAKFCVLGSRVTPEYITELIANDWFKERVFDSWLWHSGVKQKAQPY